MEYLLMHATTVLPPHACLGMEPSVNPPLFPDSRTRQIPFLLLCLCPAPRSLCS